MKSDDFGNFDEPAATTTKEAENDWGNFDEPENTDGLKDDVSQEKSEEANGFGNFDEPEPT